MPLLSRTLCLHDPRCPKRGKGIACGNPACIQDAENFIQKGINDARIVLSPEEREELVAEGLAILVRLVKDYRPHIEGHATDNGRLSGYAAMFLRRKLGDAWHRLHPEHLLVSDPVLRRRRWKYTEKAASLEAVMFDTDNDRDRRTPGALVVVDDMHEDLAKRLADALERRWARRRPMFVHVGVLLSEGNEPGDVAETLHLSPEQVKEAIADIALAKQQSSLDSEEFSVQQIEVALNERWRRRKSMIVHVGELLSDNNEPGDIAEIMNIPVGEVRGCFHEIAQVAAEMTGRA